MTIELLTFDLDDTLWDVKPTLISAEQTTFAWIQAHCPEAASLYTFDTYKEYKRQITQSYPHMAHKLSQLRKDILRRVFLQTRLTRDEAQALAEQAFEVFYHARSQVTLYPHARTVLSSLSKRYPLCAITNGNADLGIIGLDDVFHHHIKADDFDAPKPAPDMFEAALAHHQVRACNTVHIGDHPEQDIHAAKQLGMRTIWMNSQNACWPNDIPKADVDITDLKQLPDAITELANKA